MSSRKANPSSDDFLVWFESLTLEKQREALRIAERIEQELLIGVISIKLLANLPLHIPPAIDSPFFLN